MKNRFRKSISILLAFILISSLLPGVALTAAADSSAGGLAFSPRDDAPTIIVSNATGKVGDTIDVPISLENNPGIIVMMLSVSYNRAVLRQVGVEDKGVLGEEHHFVDDEDSGYQYPYTLYWANDRETVNFTANGAVAVLRFEILSEAKDSPITVSYFPEDIYGAGDVPVHFDTVNGAVSTTAPLYGDVNGDGAVDRSDQTRLNLFISGIDRTPNNFVEANADVNGDGIIDRSDQTRLNQFFSGLDRTPLGPKPGSGSRSMISSTAVADKATAVIVSSGSGKAGEEVTLAVALEENPGVSSYGLTMKYDKDKLEYVSAAVGDIIAENFAAVPILENSMTFSAFTTSGASVTGGTVLFTMTFKIKDGTAGGVIEGSSLELGYFDMFDGFAISSTEVAKFGVQQGKITVEDPPVLDSIEVITMPTKTVYYTGENLNLADMIVTAKYSDDSTKTVTSYTTVPANGAALSVEGQQSITVSYSEDGVTKTATFNVSVIPPVLLSISVASMPDKTVYFEGEKLDLTGLEILALYSNGQYKTVTGFTTDPADGTVLDGAGQKIINVYYSDGGVNTAYHFYVTVNEKPFFPVTGITGLPTAGVAGTPVVLTGTVAPANATNQTIVWSIKDQGATGATISGGNLNATAAGTATITATIANGLAVGSDYVQDFTVTFSLPFVPVTGITGLPTAGTAGTPVALTGTVAPVNATNQTIVWSLATGSTAPGASVSGSQAGATGAGTVNVVATIVDGLGAGINYTQSFTITFSLPFVPVTGITGVPTAGTVGTPVALTGTVAPANATNQTIVWSIKDQGATGATISGGNLNATAAGTATVTATIANGLAVGSDYVQDFTITFSLPFVPVTGITGLPTAGTAGTPVVLTGTVAPANATNKTITWTVKDPGSTGATISGGNLNATAAGTATVTATIANGLAVGSDYVQDFTVTFSLPFVPVTGITGVPTAGTAGTPMALTGTVAPANATNQTIVWSLGAGSTAPGASVSGGQASATGAGTVNVVATIVDGLGAGTNYTQSFTITFSLAFVPVTGITGVPTAGTAGTPVALTGTVAPANATNKTIAWTVKDPGSTGATISGGNLNATAAGTATVTATIANGLAVGSDYVQDFMVTFSLDFVPVTNIASISVSATVGVPLILAGTVVPANATNQTIVWSVKDPGSTGATISGGYTLNTTAAGTAIITATIANGTADRGDYIQDFSIDVKEATVGEPVKLSIHTNPVSYITGEVECVLSIRDAVNVLDIELDIELDSSMLAFKGIEKLNGFSYVQGISWVHTSGNTWRGTITITYPSGGSSGFTSESPVDFVKFIFVPLALGDTTVKLTSVNVVGHTGETTEYIDSIIEVGEATTTIDRLYSKYDLNRDGLVDALDLSIMLLYCGFDKDSPHWNTLVKVNDSKGKGVTASMCDVNGDGIIDMLDLLDLFIHYTD
ncbi:MAG: dockerin type I domain-containing protein [Clostridiales bacterium]|nr:dockerin type I domain-containing protein [Clostridiales bacterium]